MPTSYASCHRPTSSSVAASAAAFLVTSSSHLHHSNGHERRRSLIPFQVIIEECEEDYDKEEEQSKNHTPTKAPFFHLPQHALEKELHVQLHSHHQHQHQAEAEKFDFSSSLEKLMATSPSSSPGFVSLSLSPEAVPVLSLPCSSISCVFPARDTPHNIALLLIDAEQGKQALQEAMKQGLVCAKDHVLLVRIEAPIRYVFLRTPAGQEMAQQQSSALAATQCEVVTSMASELRGWYLEFDCTLLRGTDHNKVIVDACVKKNVDLLLLTRDKTGKIDPSVCSNQLECQCIVLD